jgi:hypothetical protein
MNGMSNVAAQKALAHEIAMAAPRSPSSEFPAPGSMLKATHFAALTLAIVLLREQVMSDSTPANRKIVVDQELDRLEKKRAELEEQFESRIGGS